MATNNAVNEPTAASGKVLQGQGVGTTSAFSTATYPATATGTGTILRADGTNWTPTTTTYPNTNAVNTILYASSANIMAALPTANNAVLATDGSGVPSISATPTVTSITFGAGSALSSFVEGTFTPTFSLATAGTSSFTYSTQAGRYTKIGNAVHIIAEVLLSNYTQGTGSGNFQLSSLPFTAANIANQLSDISCGIAQITLGSGFTYISCQIEPNTTNGTFPKSGTATTLTRLGPSGATTNSEIRASGWFSTA